MARFSQHAVEVKCRLLGNVSVGGIVNTHKIITVFPRRWEIS